MSRSGSAMTLGWSSLAPGKAGQKHYRPGYIKVGQSSSGHPACDRLNPDPRSLGLDGFAFAFLDEEEALSS